MKPKDLFGVAIRIFGLYCWRVGLLYVYDFWYSSRYPNTQPYQGVRPEDVRLYLVFAAIYLVGAVYFLAGAPHLLRFSYPERGSEPKEESEAEHSEKSDI